MANVTKRKLDCVIKESIQINTINKISKLVDDAEKYSTNQNSYMLTNTELYSNKNIKLILLHHMQDKVIDVDIFDYDVNKGKEVRWNKQQKKLIKKLKFDLYKFASSQLTEKFYILGHKDNNAIIKEASIIRFYTQNDENTISIVPLIDYMYSHNLFGLFNNDEIIFQYTDGLSGTKECGILIRSEGIDIGKFIEVIKLRINNIDNPINIDEDIKKVIEVPSSNYKIAHQEIVDKYKIEFQDNEGQGNYSSEEDEILDVIDQIKDTIEYEEIICEVVEQLITRAVRKSERGKKTLSWDISVIDNEGRTHYNKKVKLNKKGKLNNRKDIEIFAKAVEKWDLELFKEAKDKSKDFAKLVNYFNNEINLMFWGHFHRNSYYQACLSGKRSFNEERKIIEKKCYDLLQDLEGYIFLIKNVPNLLGQLRAEQYSIIRDLPEDRQKNRSKDLIELIDAKISVVDSRGDTNDQVITDVLIETINLTNGDLQGIKQDNTEQNKLDEQENKNTSSIINTENNILCVESATQGNIELLLNGDRVADHDFDENNPNNFDRTDDTYRTFLKDIKSLQSMNRYDNLNKLDARAIDKVICVLASTAEQRDQVFKELKQYRTDKFMIDLSVIEENNEFKTQVSMLEIIASGSENNHVVPVSIFLKSLKYSLGNQQFNNIQQIFDKLCYFYGRDYEKSVIFEFLRDRIVNAKSICASELRYLLEDSVIPFIYSHWNERAEATYKLATTHKSFGEEGNRIREFNEKLEDIYHNFSQKSFREFKAVITTIAQDYFKILDIQGNNIGSERFNVIVGDAIEVLKIWLKLFEQSGNEILLSHTQQDEYRTWKKEYLTKKEFGTKLIEGQKLGKVAEDKWKKDWEEYLLQHPDISVDERSKTLTKVILPFYCNY